MGRGADGQSLRRRPNVGAVDVGASRTPRQGRRRRSVALGVGAYTPTATLGVLPAVGVGFGHVAQKFRSGGHRHGVTYTPTATLGV
jgi:hypothetical protein